MRPARGLALLVAVVVLAVTLQPAPAEALEPTTMLLIAGAIVAVVLIVTVVIIANVRDQQRGQVSLLLAHADPALETP
jgi:zinc transporter ZupT